MLRSTIKRSQARLMHTLLWPLKSHVTLFSPDLTLDGQDAQLSQRDRAARCVIVFAKSRTLELGDNDLRTL